MSNNAELKEAGFEAVVRQAVQNASKKFGITLDVRAAQGQEGALTIVAERQGLAKLVRGQWREVAHVSPFEDQLSGGYNLAATLIFSNRKGIDAAEIHDAPTGWDGCARSSEAGLRFAQRLTGKLVVQHSVFGL